MKTIDEVLQMMGGRMERAEVEMYIERQWLRPHRVETQWRFEEIDVARLELVRHLARDIEINAQGVDVVLSLLDQLYATRARLQHLRHALNRQPASVRQEILSLIKQLAGTEGAAGE